MRFLQYLKPNEVRLVKFPIDVGNFVIVVPSKYSSNIHSMFSPNSGILFTFEQLERIRISRDFISNLLGSFLRFLQPFRLRSMRFLWTPFDGCKPSKLIQSSRTNFFRFGISLKLRVSINFSDLFNWMNFNLSKDCK